jgi:hypothetical protein
MALLFSLSLSLSSSSFSFFSLPPQNLGAAVVELFLLHPQQQQPQQQNVLLSSSSWRNAIKDDKWKLWVSWEKLYE